MIERMIEIRQDADETQRDLAKAIHYHQVQIARYEKGNNTPSIQYLVDFCRHYMVSSDYILGLPEGLKWPRRKEGRRVNCTK